MALYAGRQLRLPASFQGNSWASKVDNNRPMDSIRRKTGGRIAGTPNRISTQLRAMMACVLEQELNNLPELLQKVSPSARLAAVLKITELLCPSHYDWDRVSITADWDKLISLKPEEATQE